MVIAEFSKVYIACPKNIPTGGPECLHQFCHTLRKKGIDANIIYTSNLDGVPGVMKEYAHYQVQVVETINDHPNNVLIVPETMTHLLGSCPKSKKVIYWLSVDNWLASIKNQLDSVSQAITTGKIKAVTQFPPFFYFGNNQDIFHFVQSEYARQFLLANGIDFTRIYVVTDFINRMFLEKSKLNRKRNKENIVVFNPKKGWGFTQKIIQASGDLKFVAIQNMTPEQVSELLSIAKVYIDFGNHPGKDRIPREAAVSGCCIITGRRGSANYKEDIWIDDCYKFEDKEENISEIIERIRTIFKEFEKETQKFEEYRDRIDREEETFSQEIDKLL